MFTAAMTNSPSCLLNQSGKGRRRVFKDCREQDCTFSEFSSNINQPLIVCHSKRCWSRTANSSPNCLFHARAELVRRSTAIRHLSLLPSLSLFGHQTNKSRLCVVLTDVSAMVETQPPQSSKTFEDEILPKKEAFSIRYKRTGIAFDVNTQSILKVEARWKRGKWSLTQGHTRSPTNCQSLEIMLEIMTIQQSFFPAWLT